MDTALYNDKYKLLLRNLTTHTQYSNNPVKFDGRAFGQSFMHYTEEQCRNILQSLQDDVGVLKILKYKSKNKPNDPLGDSNYYWLEIYPQFSDYANKLIGLDSVKRSSAIHKPLTIRYISQTNTLDIGDNVIVVMPNTIEGIIINSLINGHNKTVEILTVENIYKLKTGKDDNYILTKEELGKKVKALNQKVRRSLHTKLGLISIKGKSLAINTNLVTFSSD